MLTAELIEALADPATVTEAYKALVRAEEVCGIAVFEALRDLRPAVAPDDPRTMRPLTVADRVMSALQVRYNLPPEVPVPHITNKDTLEAVLRGWERWVYQEMLTPGEKERLAAAPAWAVEMPGGLCPEERSGRTAWLFDRLLGDDPLLAVLAQARIVRGPSEAIDPLVLVRRFRDPTPIPRGPLKGQPAGVLAMVLLAMRAEGHAFFNPGPFRGEGSIRLWERFARERWLTPEDLARWTPDELQAAAQPAAGPDPAAGAGVATA